ncbi:hypothetical protein V8F20_006157 [Naviculisporaceae sp. PSN 640]
MRNDLFQRLPPPTAALLVAAILLQPTSAHVLQHFPRQTPPPSTTTHSLHALDVVSWPLLLPTPAPLNPLDLLRRQVPATVCGYIGGNPDLPATCSAGSHCVLDSAHGVIGCCPDGEEKCSSGVFTDCVDANSGPQTEVNPYVFTCAGNNVCYKNQFDGGFSQFGCGTASDLGTTVLAAASGITGDLDRQTASMDLTATASPLSEPTTLGTQTTRRTSTSASSDSTSSSSTSESSSESSSQSSSASSSSETPPPTSSTMTLSSSTTETSTSSTPARTTDPPAAPSAAPPPDRTGAIVGGTVSGVAALVAVAALAFFFYRRRQQNLRQGPGRNNSPHGTYISAPKPGPGTGFTAIDQSGDAYERALLPPVSTAPAFSNDLSAGGPSPFAYRGAAGVHDSYPPAERVPSSNYSDYSYPGQYPAAYAAAAAAQGGYGHSRLEPDQIPLTREIDDFSHGFQQALGRIGEEDEPPYNGNGNGNGTGHYNGAVRPLWQQNRRQSRNLMWM